MLNYGTQADILKGNLLGNKGALFENFMVDFLCKSGQKLYYFHKDSGLELDFWVSFKGECVILYMGFLVEDTIADVIIPDVGLSLLTI